MSFTPTGPELLLVNALFNAGDPQKLGIISGENAVNVLGGANVSANVLGEIWSIADADNNGFLTRKGAAVLIRLLGWAQKGEPVKEELLNKVGPLPTIDGLSLPKSGTPPPGSPTLSAVSRPLPPLSAEDRAKFIRIFVGCGPSGGLITAEKARDVFVKSNLPNETLGMIWNLADTQKRGQLDQVDFVVGMYFIQLAMSQPGFPIPASLPHSLYEQASGGRPPQVVRTHMTGGSTGTHSPTPSSGFASPVKPQYTGQILRPQLTGQGLSAQNTGSLAQSRLSMAPSILSNFSTSTAATSTGSSWDISIQEKATADSFFATLDTQKRGYIEGDIAVPFMVKSGLPEAVLAQIWDLADLHKDGRLTQDGFAIALHLINNKLTGKEVPEALPQSLVPPSMRNDTPQQSTIQQDLWLLGDTPPSSAHNPQPPFTPQQTGGRPKSPPAAVPRAPVTTFERSLMDEEEAPTPVTAGPDRSIEIGNLQNQLNSTNRSLETTKNDRAQVENSVAVSAATLSQLETQLAAAKAAYETETRLVADLREKLITQTNSINKTRQELISAESDLSGLRQEKDEIGGGLLRDKDEVRELQRKMKQVSEETEVIKKDIEKVKKDARHQKGLLAISKKQLVTAEGEREKAEKELEVAKKELEVATAEVAEAQKAESDAAAAVSLPSSTPASPPAFEQPAPLSFAAAFLPGESEAAPSPKSTKSLNPFAIMAAGGTGTPRSGPPFSAFPVATPPSEAAPAPSAEDPFGLSTVFAGQPANTPPPVASQIASPALVETPARIASPVAAVSLNEPRNEASPPSQAVPEASSPPPKAASPPPKTSLDEDFFGLGHKVEPSTGTDESSKFPPLEDNEELDTDLPPLKEIQEAEETTSEEDSDDEPLGNIVKGKGKAVEKTASPESNRAASPFPARDASPVTTEATSSAFDSVFGTGNTGSVIDVPPKSGSPEPTGLKAISPTPSGSITETATPFEPPSPKSPPKPLASIETVLEPPKATAAPASARDFDEAFTSLGAKPSDGAAPTESTTFSFDDAFGDTFDFAKPATDAPSAINGGPAPSGLDAFGAAFDVTPAASKPTATATTFDDVFAGFGSPSAEAQTSSKPAVSFDDAFNVPSPSQTLPAINTQRKSSIGLPPAPGKNSTPATPLRLASPTSSRFSTVDTTQQEPQPVPATAPAPIRSASPAPSGNAPSVTISSPNRGSERTSSPRPWGKKDRKPSAATDYPPPSGPAPGSSSTPVEVPAPVKTSKFHFPGFGRSKTVKKPSKSDKDPKPPPTHPSSGRRASPSVNSSVLSATDAPAPGEDVEGVRTITAMGFTREQAVNALEKHGYDLNRAIGELLET